MRVSLLGATLLVLLSSACRTPDIEPPTDTGWEGDCLSPLVAESGEGMDFSLIPAGLFAMGSPEDQVGWHEEEVWHEVMLTYATCMQATELTRRQFVGLAGYEPAWVDGCEGQDCPVIWVNWHEAAAVANALSESLDLPPCYDCSGSFERVLCQAPRDPHACRGYRLPTEAEWEHAARAGSGMAFDNGGELYAGSEQTCEPQVPLDNGTSLDEFTWYCGNSGRQSHEVGALAPNDWGLHDVSGNVWEWVHDWYEAELVAAVDPAGPPTGTHRSVRGGSWDSSPASVRVASRAGALPGLRYVSLGFRLARTARPETAGSF